jgi:hypothetical protein
MTKEYLESVRHAFHAVLQKYQKLSLGDNFACHDLMYICGTLSMQNEKGFVNFLENLSILPKLTSRFTSYHASFSDNTTVLDYLVVQVAKILLDEDDWIPLSETSFGGGQVKYWQFYHCLFGGWKVVSLAQGETCPNLRVYGMTQQLKRAVMNGNAAELKLLVDLAANPDNRLKYIYNYLFNQQNHHLAEQLHLLVGKMDELIPPAYLFDYWRDAYICTCKEYRATWRDPMKLQEEWLKPDQHPLHHLVLKGPYKHLAFHYLRASVEFDENTFQEFYDNGGLLDAAVSKSCPHLTYRKLMYFFAEFADELLKAAEYCAGKNQALLCHARSAKNFIAWEQKNQSAQ